MEYNKVRMIELNNGLVDKKYPIRNKIVMEPLSFNFPSHISLTQNFPTR